MSSAVTVTGASVALSGNPILSNIDLDVRVGELVALVGPNGAGKSTLLAVISGDVRPDAGDVTMFGRALDSWRPAEAARHRAVQTQQARVSFAFTGAEVVRMGRAPWHGTDEAERDDEVVAAAMDLTETLGFAQRRVPTLSGGEAARVSFSRALAQETALLLLDEPTAALDLRHQEMELAHMRDRADAGVAVVVVLHDLSLAAAYADRVVLLDHGVVVADGTPREVLTAELLTQVYRHPVTVIDDPISGGPVVLPVRSRVRESV
ncbi:heme ABC transporter ATP-binding protein [Tessaracoccus palaemonis]|uniref:Heme ABC transporter ATP-binding protein n=1 Tax=Tessaracoccus palaemonis TaxID=2829499 RepID=A0ABX8SFU8_9ACTN|nr:heme ABC transporter ATP-binding protein [Tessaracoccus palaemonis]QXT62272.1 heme ABC transporter ATP-binding protein [Tessaracoccus palaemonis]